MGYTKDQLLDRLRELQIDFVCYDHPAVLTVEAQAKHVGHLGGGLSKNLLLKDKKHRFYVVSALADTNVDLKVLSQRLGLGKGGLRMAPEEAIQELLQVPPGCVTPFAFINDSARTVSLLLDQGFKANECCFFHPLSNDMTISLSPSNLEKFLTSIGRKPSYVDLEANPKVGKDNPPDLADLVLSEVSSLSDQMEKVVSIQKHVPAEKSTDLTGTSNQIEKAVSPPKHVPLEKKSTNHTVNTRPNNSKATLEKSQHTLDPASKAVNVPNFIKEVIDKTTAVVLSEINKAGDLKKDIHDSVVDAVSMHITSDLENLAVMLKNEAYSQGFHAGFRSALPQKYW